MSFKVWIRKYEGDSSPIGDLASDVKRDKQFPVTHDWRKMLRHLESRQADCLAKLAFLEAYRIYTEEVM